MKCEEEGCTCDGYGNFNGWREWNGGDCPVLDDTAVEVRLRNGIVDKSPRADVYIWEHGRVVDHDIVAYRVVQKCSHAEGAECELCVKSFAPHERRTAPIDRALQAKADIDATLAERDKRYGSFDGHAQITQDLKTTMVNAPKWDSLAADQKEALEMVAHKVGRILNGDPDYIDSWLDISGYATLIVRRLEKEQKQ